MKEIPVWLLRWKLNHLDDEAIKDKIIDLQEEIRPFIDRPSSEGFKLLNDSTNNQTYSLLIEIAEKRKLQV